MFLKANSAKDVFIHLLIILGIFIGLVLCFFYLYLPATTNHGETITVPKLTGMNSQELESFLKAKHLRYQINDSSYTPGVKPYTILTQHPIEGSKVKKNRKIYVAIASTIPPKVKMPKLIDASLRSAETTLRSLDLVVGKITYVPNPFPNLVLKQLIKGQPVKAGTLLSKGTKVDLVVSNGTGSEEFDVPDVVGMDVEEARLLLESQGIGIGLTRSDPSSSKKKGTITKQRPAADSGRKIKPGEEIDIWVTGAVDPGNSLDEFH
jgi:beta-lactam-binding protein with PASTA domain